MDQEAEVSGQKISPVLQRQLMSLESFLTKSLSGTGRTFWRSPAGRGRAGAESFWTEVDLLLHCTKHGETLMHLGQRAACSIAGRQRGLALQIQGAPCRGGRRK